MMPQQRPMLSCSGAGSFSVLARYPGDPACACLFANQTKAFIPFGASFQALGVSILMVQSLFLPQWAIYRVLNWKPVVILGILSHPLYIWQELVWRARRRCGQL